MRQNLRVSLGAVVLALATLAAMIFALINFDQRSRFEVVYDGVAWLDTDHGIQASQVSPNSPATRAGIRAGDYSADHSMAPRSPERRKSLAGWSARGSGLRSAISFRVAVKNSKRRSSRRPRRNPWPPRITCASWACCISSSDYSFLSAAGTLLAPCTSTFFAWSLSSSGRSISAESWTPSTGKSTGRRLPRACWRPPCCCTSHWFFRGARKQPFAHLRNSWPFISCLSLFC